MIALLIRRGPLAVHLAAYLLVLAILPHASAREPDRQIPVWPDLAPGETTRSEGTALPRRPNENPPATRIKDITRPLLDLYLPTAEPVGTLILICPGGGYNYVVSDKEGSEAAEWLNKLGITACVLRYRTRTGQNEDPAVRPLQDAQRSLRVLRHLAEKEQIQAGRFGLLGFSAGGQLVALATTGFERDSYQPIDPIDKLSCRPDFSLLIYPWRLVSETTDQLRPDIVFTDQTPPCFLVHAHDDSASSLSSVLFYAGLKQAGVEAELHIYRSGGHGYGMRAVNGSVISTWPDRATDWLRGRKLLKSID